MTSIISNWVFWPCTFHLIIIRSSTAFLGFQAEQINNYVDKEELEKGVL